MYRSLFLTHGRSGVTRSNEFTFVFNEKQMSIIEDALDVAVRAKQEDKTFNNFDYSQMQQWFNARLTW